VTSTTTSPAELDPATLTAIRQAMASAQAGRIGDACATAEQALASGGDEVALNAMLGMLRGQAGDQKGAIRHLEIAHRARPNDARIAANLASALAAEGDLPRAIEAAARSLAFSDPSQQLARIRGYIAQALENHASAIEAYEHVVSAAPDDWESWNNLGNSRLAMGNFPDGIKALRRSAELNPNALLTRLNLARALRHAGEFEEAERLLRTAADEFSQDVQPLIDLHDLLKVQGRSDEEVLQVLERAIPRDPRNVELLLGLARQHTLLLQMEQAEAAYRSAIAVDAANSEAFVGIATVYEHSRPAAMEELVAEAERHSLDSGTLNLLHAFAHRRAKRHAEGLAALEGVPEELAPARREDLLGQFQEALGDYDAAFAAFSRMNEIQAEDPSRPVFRAAELRKTIGGQFERTTADWAGSWKAPPLDADRPAPTFLVGFPRSGTTLLDTMLMGHPGVEVMEERPCLSTVGNAFGGFDRIAELDEAEVRRAQASYFEEASKYVDVRSGAHLVDKSPLHLNSVPLIRRLFPNARFILALRHPADVILSCFVSNFRLNPAMSNFVRLDTAAEFYDLTFRYWERSREIFPLEVHTVVYEDLIENTEAELRRLAGAMSLEWRDEMLDHRKTAAGRGVITTASYAQVTEPIYRRSVGRWERYRKHLEPILPTLAPWAEKFGYRI
jgi:tetratricopeptide (TPR) repeat protein